VFDLLNRPRSRTCATPHRGRLPSPFVPFVFFVAKIKNPTFRKANEIAKIQVNPTKSHLFFLPDHRAIKTGCRGDRDCSEKRNRGRVCKTY
jgi:hypothetical protein